MKNGKNYPLLIMAMLTTTGCAANSGIVPMGSGEFMISKQAATGFSGLGKLKAKVLQEAGRHCAERDKDLKVISSDESQPPYVFGNYPRVEVRFRCIQ